jgi:hypothetical protein
VEFRGAGFPLSHDCDKEFHHGSPAPDSCDIAKVRDTLDGDSLFDEITVGTVIIGVVANDSS